MIDLSTIMRAHPARSQQQEARSRPWALLALLVVAQFMVVLDITIVNVALPSIGAGLGFAESDLQWVVTAYVLASGGLVLVGGRAADLLGRRRMLLAGLGVFTAASLVCGLAPSPAALVAARAVQGAGAALLTPAALAIITTTYEGTQRATALSVWGAIGTAGVAAGALLGGVLTTVASWHWVFLVNVPVGLATGALAVRIVPRSAGAVAGGRRSLDLAGCLSAVAGLAVLVYALSGAADHGWGSARTLALLALAAALLGSFPLIERRVARPLLPPVMWRSRSLVSAVAMMLGVTGILAGTFFVSSVYLQGTLGWSALGTGLAFLPIIVALVLGVHATAHAVGRVGSRRVLLSGLGLVILGGLAMALGPDRPSAAELLPSFFVLGLGIGLAFPAISITAMSEVGHDHAGVASGLVSTAHEIGAALGVAALSAVALATPSVTSIDYGAATLATAIAAAVLAAVAAVAFPAVRPAPGARAAMH
jgi:EmrB/QacA subfamily drug resistance transporter